MLIYVGIIFHDANMVHGLAFPVLFALVAFSSKFASCYVCDDDFCTKNGCKTPANCDGGRWIKGGGLCGCCDLCIKSLDEGAKCSTRGENGFPNGECGAGLACDADKKICLPRNSKCISDLQEYDQLRRSGSLVIGRLRPQCDYMGDYVGPQCIAGVVCFCVDENGERVFGTAHYTMVSSMNCGCSQAANRLGGRLSQMQSVGLRVPHIFSFPQGNVDSEIGVQTLPPFAHCMPDGRYDGLQCVDDTCFCIDDQGGLLQQEMVNVNVKSIMLCYDPSYHEESYYRACELELQLTSAESLKMSSLGTRRLGADPPRCELDGTYAHVQCHDDKCFCVHKNGSRIGQYESPRYEDFNRINCYCASDKVFVVDPILAAQMKCLENGNYAPVQCQGSLCYCVNRFGLQVGPEVDAAMSHSLDCKLSNSGYARQR